MNVLLKHTDVTRFFAKHLEHTTDWKKLTDHIRGTLLPVFYIVYFGQDILQGSISSDDEKMKLAKMGPGYGLWVTTISDAIDNNDKINTVIDAFAAVNNLLWTTSTRSISMGCTTKQLLYPFRELLLGRSPWSDPRPTQWKSKQSRRFSSLHSKRYYKLRLRHRPLPSSSSLWMSRKKWLPRTESTR
jgi:hypothetical protein